MKFYPIVLLAALTAGHLTTKPEPRQFNEDTATQKPCGGTPYSNSFTLNPLPRNAASLEIIPMHGEYNQTIKFAPSDDDLLAHNSVLIDYRKVGPKDAFTVKFREDRFAEYTDGRGVLQVAMEMKSNKTFYYCVDVELTGGASAVYTQMSVITVAIIALLSL